MSEELEINAEIKRLKSKESLDKKKRELAKLKLKHEPSLFQQIYNFIFK